jgi:hypothetical protein
MSMMVEYEIVEPYSEWQLGFARRAVPVRKPNGAALLRYIYHGIYVLVRAVF